MTPLEIVLLILLIVLCIQHLILELKNEQIAGERDYIEDSHCKLLDEIYNNRRLEPDDSTEEADRKFVSQPTRVRY